MLALRTSPQPFGVAEGERIARESYGLAVSASPLPGERDCNFRLRAADLPGAGRHPPTPADTHEFVLKIQDLAADADSGDCLVSVLDHLAEQDPGLPVPRLFPTLDGEALGRFSRDGMDYTTCLVSYLPGQLLAGSSPGAVAAALVSGFGGRLVRPVQGPLTVPAEK